MTVPQNKEALLQAIERDYHRLRADLDSVPPERAREATMPGHAQGTQMSVADLVAYLIGWNSLVLKWCAGKAAGQPVDFPETGYRWNELGRLAQQFYADHAERSYPELLQRFADVQTRIVALVHAQSDDALYGAPWYSHYTQGRMIQLNTSSPYANARARLRRWQRDNGLA